MTKPNIKHVVIVRKIVSDVKKYGFCKLVETGEDVFIPPHVIDTMSENTGDEAFAEIGENIHAGSSTKYRVMMFHDQDGPFRHLLQQFKYQPVQDISPKEPTALEVQQWMMNVLEENIGTFLTTATICNQVAKRHNYRIDSQTGATTLGNLNKRGMIAKTQLHNTLANKRAIFTMWHSARNASETYLKNMGDGELYG